MKKIFSIVMIMTAVVSPLRAEIETTVGADLVSEYIWRGAKCGDAAFSSYCEISAPFSLGGADWTATLGMVPFESGFYGTEGFAVTNVSLSAAKSIDITESFSLPVSAGVTFNPCAEMAYLVFGFSF